MNFVWLKRKKIQNPCISKIRVSKEKMSKNVHLKFFWTQFKIVHCRGPCSLRPCISRPCCINQNQVSTLKKSGYIATLKKYQVTP